MELTILKDIVIIFALSTLVNLVFNKLKIPAVVGYLLTGVIAGPHMLSLVEAGHEIDLMAEIGVILLLFTIGLEFSLEHLLKIRRIVFLGGFLQVTFTAALFYIVSRFYGISSQGAMMMGFLIALSSSALVLKILQERSELTSNYGRTVLGILIFQDLLLVPLLLLTELMGNNGVDVTKEVFLLIGKVIIIIGLVWTGNKWILPKLLHVIALTRNQELFMMSNFLICFAIALLTYSMGMSLAFGAFLAGLMVSESEYSYNAFGNFQPVKDVFASFFFVSIGMLLDLRFVVDNFQLILVSFLLVLVLKSIIGAATGFLLGHTLQGTVMIGLALSQVGEFSFILAKKGADYKLLPDFFYHLFLAIAVITMAFTPFVFYLSAPVSRILLKLPLPAFMKQGLFPLKEIELPEFSNHLVVIGKDASAIKLSKMARDNDIRHISIVFDPALARDKMNEGELVVYGDAVNEPILRKAHVDRADIVVVSVGSLIPSMAIIGKVRNLNKEVYIIARATLTGNMEQLYRAGADYVLAEKLEIAIDLLNRVLVKKMVSEGLIGSIVKEIRKTHLGEFSDKDPLNQLFAVEKNIGKDKVAGNFDI